MALIDEGAEPLENDLLAQVEKGLEASMNAQTRRQYDIIVLSGMQAAMKGGTKGMLRNLPQSKDPVRDCAIGAVNVAFLTYKGSQGQGGTQLSEAAVTFASYGLMLQALDMAAKMGLVEITGGTGGTIDQAFRIATDRIMANIDMTKEKLTQAAAKVKNIMQDPQMMEKLELEVGTKRDPRAAQPTMTDVEEAANGAD